MAVFQEIEAIPLTNRVAAALKDAFFSGKLKPGDPIVERQVAPEMKVGTPVVREALICLQGQGLVRGVTNTGTFVTKFSAEEVRQLCTLRVELEVLALEWARSRVSASDLAGLKALVDDLVQAGEAGVRREFLERDFIFHKRCWELSGNTYLTDTLERLMAPLFAFVVLGSSVPMTGATAWEHYALVDALGNLQPPEFDNVIRKTLGVFSQRWIASMSPSNGHKAG